MNKLIYGLCLLFITSTSFALNKEYFRDNTDVAITLSSSNYNRLHVENDKIIKAYFPEDSMLIKNDEDGSLYAISQEQKQFTIFITTENGHHFSATINADDSLGKTIEFIPIVVKKPSLPVIKPKSEKSSLIKDMMSNHVSLSFSKKRHFGKVKRLSQGLTLIPKTTYENTYLKGEVIEVYNGSKQKIFLQENLFKTNLTKEIHIKHLILEPHQKTEMYLVSENTNG